jgi:hypothetical protein
MNDHQLESYLARLDKSLGPIAISEKADIITEIKSHVMEALENDESTNMNEVLASLGEPEQVANRYLMERGLKPNRPAKHPIVKWITIGFLGTFGISAFVFLILIWKFSPLVKVDEEKGQVQILGGLIDVNEKQGKVKIGKDFELNVQENEFSGQQDTKTNGIELVKIDFSNGKVRVEPSLNEEVIYKCKVVGKFNSTGPVVSEKMLNFEMSKTTAAKCKIELPERVSLQIEGTNGDVEIKNVKSDINVNLMNGKIKFSPDGKSFYKYNSSVLNGKTDEFVSSDSEEAYKINFNIVNGKINKIKG